MNSQMTKQDAKMAVFATKQEAIDVAVSIWGAEYVEHNVVEIIKRGPTIAKLLGSEVGYVIDPHGL